MIPKKASHSMENATLITRIKHSFLATYNSLLVNDFAYITSIQPYNIAPITITPNPSKAAII